ncbi:MAG TPA: hypothetical protein VFS99_05200, partial [Xanthomonadaceae bacterium]|nr:hypothetical protein [Xanthomonadaceae bacterium]
LGGDHHMNKFTLLPCLLLAAGSAQGQSTAAAPCPHLAAASGLAWEHRAGPDYDFCRALDAAGTQVLGVYVGADSPFEPYEDLAAETGTIDGREVTWYSSELAGDPEAQVRETLLVLPDGREAHVWLRAANRNELAGKLELAQGLSFEPVLLSGP